MALCDLNWGAEATPPPVGDLPPSLSEATGKQTRFGFEVDQSYEIQLFIINLYLMFYFFQLTFYYLFIGAVLFF